MTKRFIEHIKNSGSEDCSRALGHLIEKLSKRRRDPDIEVILQSLHRLIDYKDDDLSAFLGQDTGFDRDVLLKLRSRLEAFIRNQTIRPSTIDYLRPLLDPVFGWPAEIFSVNYDTCVELLCRDMQRRLVDGFTPEWNPRSLEAEDNAAAYLYKLHGSVLWYRSTSGWLVKVPIGLDGTQSETAELKLYDGESASPILLYPMFKQPMESPLLDFTYILKQRLEMANILIVIGYSFRDEYVAALFRDAFRAHPKLHMINIGPDSRLQYLKLIGKNPSFKTAFWNRVTCLPFPVEKVLKKLAADYQAFPALIQRWHDHQSLVAIGRNALCADQVEPLSKQREVALSNLLVSEPANREQLGLDTILAVSLRNYAVALAMADPGIVSDCRDQFLETLQSLWRMFNANVSFAGGGNWQVACDVRRPGPNGSAASSISFSQFSIPLRQAIQDIDDVIHDLHVENKDRRTLLERYREKAVALQKFFDQIGSQNVMMHGAFREIIRPQLVERQSDFDQWDQGLSRMAGNQAPQVTAALMKICHPILPRAFNDLLKELEGIEAAQAPIAGASS